MNSKTLNNWMQFLASVGVILSLIFVGVQIQQSREIAIADIYQQRTALLLQHFSFAVPTETEFRAWMKDRAGEPLNPAFISQSIFSAALNRVRREYQLRKIAVKIGTHIFS